MAKKGDWVRIHKVVLRADDRTAKIPEDTKRCDFEMWTKGVLQDEKSQIGDLVTIQSAVGRLETGTLIEEEPHYTHSYGEFIPEIIEIDNRLRAIMAGGDK